MKTTWTLLACGAAAALFGGIVAQPWALGQQAASAPAPPAPVAAPTPPPEFEWATVNIEGPPSDSFGPTSAYTVTFAGREEVDPAVAKARQVERKLQQQTREFVAQYANTEDEESRRKIKSSIAELLTQQFELQKEVREKELARLEEKVKKLRELLEKRSEMRDEIVQRRVEQLVIDAEGLGWVDSPGGSAFEGGFWRSEALAPAGVAVPALPPVPAFPTTTPSPPVASPRGVR